MAGKILALIFVEELFRQHLQNASLRLHFFDLPGDATPALRQELRGKILELLRNSGESISSDNERTALDLSKPLRQLDRTYISISHTENRQGVLIADAPCGFDMETIDRIKPAVVARISSPEEFAATPSAAFLWAAKEAAFKTLSSDSSVKLASQIEISDWKLLSGSAPDHSRVGIFTVKNITENPTRRQVGCVIEHKDIIFSGFLLTP